MCIILSQKGVKNKVKFSLTHSFANLLSFKCILHDSL
jgi:hypothetical protein